MATEPMVACGTCKYYRHEGVSERGYGACRALPPQPINSDDNRNRAAVWPLVWVGDWCGAYVESKPAQRTGDETV